MLLPHVASTAPAAPLSEHGANVLSDLCSSIGDVARLAGTEDGRAMLESWLGEEAKAVVEFWKDEWVCE
jgi:hypothetical protein